jgi:molybdopterin converting factor small subunit
MTNIEIEMCGRLADLTSRSLLLAFPDDGLNAGALLERVVGEFPQLGTMVASGRVKLCVNEALVACDFRVRAGDRVALLPPVSGG